MADICKLNINGTIYDIKDSIARAIIETLQNEGHLKPTDIINSLTSTSSTSALSANQGRELNINKIDNISISGNILTFSANGTTKGSITLPTSSSSGGGLTAEQITQLATAYAHSQSAHAPSNAEANVQADWNITDSTNDGFIKNKPTIPSRVSQLTNDSSFATVTLVNSLRLTKDGNIIRLMLGDIELSYINIDIVATTYSVVNNLTNCTTNNSINNIQENGAYSSTISPNNGYRINSITVTMNGTDITSSSVSGNNINISSVTGNIVITASAIQEVSGNNLSGTYNPSTNELTITGSSVSYDSTNNELSLGTNGVTYNTSTYTLEIEGVPNAE